MLRLAFAMLALVSALRAGTLEFDLAVGGLRTVKLASPVDDLNFREPRGYAAHGTMSRAFTQRITLTNTGPSVLTGRLLVVNDRDLSDTASLHRTLGLSVEPASHAQGIRRLFTFWKDHRSHAGSGAALSFEPFAALNFWGYSLCGEDTQAFARIAHSMDIPARHVQLNGHLAGEYKYDGAWHVVDGDQNAVYLGLDNRTLAGADDLRADPFLVLRTRVFGKHAPLGIAMSAFNCALIEHIAPVESKPLKIKIAAAPLNVFTVQPGESVVWHCAIPPEKPLGHLTADKPDVLRAAALATIEHRLAVKKYRGKEKPSVNVPYPILRVVNHTTGAVFTPKPGEILFNAPLDAKADTDKVSVFMQCSQLALPLLARGENIVKLAAEKGAASVMVEFADAGKITPPTATVTARVAKFDRPPEFSVAVKPRADRVWWQVAETRDFEFVAPSLEGVVPWAPELRFDPLTETFLSAGRPYFFRVKAVDGGVWGDWSEPFEFRVLKPPQPAAIRFVKLEGGRVRLAWNGPANIEYLVFASNRADAMPEIFTDTEIVALNHLTPSETRPNKNLVATVNAPAFDFEPGHHFYRVIARSGGVLSVPGPLARLPVEHAAALPPATILQVRVVKDGEKERYIAKEEKLPPPVAAEPAGEK